MTDQEVNEYWDHYNDTHDKFHPSEWVMEDVDWELNWE